ncbi:MAG: citrate synthase [Actinomycetota bacterium]|nr:citrate synthase [Actinomycetota bacterium]
MALESTPPPDHLSTKQAARVLGVKPETVYAYVSRGLLPRTRVPGRRGSWFPAELVEALRSQGPRNKLSGMAERIRTKITLLQDDRLYYRGVDAVALARSSTFEDVCALLWQTTAAALPPAIELSADDTALAATLPRRMDKIRTAISVLAGRESVRGDLTVEVVTEQAGRSMSAAIEVLPVVGANTGGRAAAERLWPRLTAMPATPALLGVLDAALILLADHELAVSTTAARVAASTRADLFGVLMAALGAMDSPIHGAAASFARRKLVQALDDPAATISRHLASNRRPAGFGHLIYTERDPRADHLLERIFGLDQADRAVLSVADQLITEWERRRGWFPNTDFALAVLGEALRMVPDAGDTVFTLSRLAGWTAHALEEYDEEPMRFRLQGIYVGVRPAER